MEESLFLLLRKKASMMKIDKRLNEEFVGFQIKKLPTSIRYYHELPGYTAKDKLYYILFSLNWTEGQISRALNGRLRCRGCGVYSAVAPSVRTVRRKKHIFHMGEERWERRRHRWAEEHVRCLTCKTKSSPHCAYGLCRSCYMKHWRKKTKERNFVISS